MQYAVDASIAAKWFIPEPHKDNAERLLRDFLEDRIQLIGPDLLGCGSGKPSVGQEYASRGHIGNPGSPEL
jgi:hypothetical protein